MSASEKENAFNKSNEGLKRLRKCEFYELLWLKFMMNLVDFMRFDKWT